MRDEPVKDAVQDVAEDVTQDVAEDVLGAAEDRSAKAFVVARAIFKRQKLGTVEDGAKDGAYLSHRHLLDQNPRQKHSCPSACP